MRSARAATVAVEVAHRGVDGRMHGHSLQVEVWTADEVDLDRWREQVAEVAAAIEGQLEDTIAARTFEAVASVFLERLPGANRVVLRLPSRGHAVEMVR